MGLTKYKLGELIESSSANNKDLKYGIDKIVGVCSDGVFTTPKGDPIDVDLRPYKIVNNGAFVYTPTRVNLGSIAYRTQGICIVSHLYVVFYLNTEGRKLIDPMWLYMYLRRKEFGREIDFRLFGSARPEFSYRDMADIEISLPPIEEQRKYVNVYLSIHENLSVYESKVDELKLVCEGYIEDLRKHEPCEEIGKYCTLKNDCKNKDLMCSNVRGVKITKELGETKADIDENTSLTNYKLVKPGEIVYVPNTARMGDKIACALSYEFCCVSPIYEILQVDSNRLIPEYLFMWFRREEFDRYARYNSWGSVRESIDWDTLKHFSIPVPSLEIQESIVDIYKCYIERKSIYEHLYNRMKNIFSILINGSLQSAN